MCKGWKCQKEQYVLETTRFSVCCDTGDCERLKGRKLERELVTNLEEQWHPYTKEWGLDNYVWASLKF
jgi:hypothetical protein